MKITELQGYTVSSPSNLRKVKANAEQKKEDGPFLRDVGTGAAKELGSTAVGVGTLGRGIQKALSKGADLLLGTEGFGLGKQDGLFDKGSETQRKAQEFLTPEGGAEKLGAFGAEMATFAIPGSKMAQATKGAGVLRTAAGLAGADALTTVVQQGEFNKETVDAAIIAAAFPVAGKGVQAAKGALPNTRDAGGRVINSLIKPLLKDFSYGKNPGQAVADAGITANSLDELAGKIKVVRQETGDQISQRVTQSASRFDATDALAPLDEAINEAKKAPKTNQALITRLNNLKDDLLQVDKNGVPKRKLSDLTADELWQFNKDVGELARWTGNATDDEIANKALRNVYGNTRSKLESGVDGLDELSEKYANLKSAEIATEYRDKIAARQNMVSLTSGQLGTGAAVVTALATGGPVGAVLVGAGAAATTEAMKSPAAKTRVAAWLASAPRSEVQQAFTDAPWLRGVLQAALFDGVEEDVQTDTSPDEE